MRKLKNWVKVLVFLVIIILIGFYFKDTITGFVVRDPCKKEANEGMVNECYVQQAVEANNVELCNNPKISDEKSISYCEQEIAVLNNDSNICEPIKHEIWKSLCFRKIGLATNDYNLCFKSSFEKDSVECFYEVAQATLDIKPCYFIANFFDRDLCVEDVAIKTKDLSICELFGDREHKRAQCITNVAFFNKDISICENLEEGDFKVNCLAQFENLEE